MLNQWDSWTQFYPYAWWLEDCKWDGKYVATHDKDPKRHMNERVTKVDWGEAVRDALEKVVN